MAEITPTNAPLPALPVAGGSPQPSMMTGPASLSPDSGDQADEGNLPMPPSGGATIGQRLQASGSPALKSPFLTNLATASSKAAASNPQVASQPGGWARTLLTGTMSALSGSNGLMDSLTDAAAATEPVPAGGGALTGIARTLQAGQQRKAAQAEAMSKEKTAELLRAETTQRIAANTRNMYRQDQETRTAAYDSNAKYMSDFRRRYDTQNDQDNITQDKLNNMLKDDPNFWKNHTGRATGEIPVMDGGKQKIDQNGNPVFEPVYSISNIAESGATERTRPISDDEATYIKNNAGVNVSKGTELTVNQYDNLMARSDGYRAVKDKIQKANGEDLTKEQEMQLNTALQNPRIQHYMSMDPKDPTGLSGLYSAAKNADAHIDAIDQMIQAVQSKVPSQPGQVNPTVQALQQKRQEFVQDGDNIDKVISGLNQKAKDDYIKRQDDQAKENEVIRHNKAEEENKAAEVKAKKGDFLGDPNAKTPEEFLNSLDPEAKATVQLIGTGRAPLNNPSYLLARNPEIMEAVARAYTDFDVSKIKSYQDTYANFTHGKTSTEIKAGATALGHLLELQSLNTATSHIPHTPAWTAYQNKADTLATELAKFYGDATVPGIAAIKETLTSTLPGNRDAAINTQAQSMSDKFNNIEQEWLNAAPSKAYQAEMPGMSLSMKQARAKLDPVYRSEHPELLGVNQTQQQQTAPGQQQAQAPKGAASPTPGKAANGTAVWQMSDGTIQDASGNKYDPKTGKPL